MHRIVGAFVLAAASCTAPPTADELELDERDGLEPNGVLAIPDGVREVAPAVVEHVSKHAGPRIDVVRTRSDEDGPGFTLAIAGFPAISTDRGDVVVPLSRMMQLSNVPGWLGVHWLDAHTGAMTHRIGIVTRDESIIGEPDEPATLTRAELESRVTAANLMLAEDEWRALEPLPVHYWDPDGRNIDEYKAEIDAADRPVQVALHGGELVARIAGVRVLERAPLPIADSLVYRVWGDRKTGTVLVVTVECTGEDCTCDPEFSAHVLHWSPQTFAAIDARACPMPLPEEGACADTRIVPFEPSLEPWDLL